MDDTMEQKQRMFKSWKKFATLLSQHPDIRYFFGGGLGIRMRAAAQQGRDLELSDLRTHQDIDCIVFDEDIISFLKIFSKEKYDIWHTPIAGLSTNAPGEFHSISLRDQETDIDIGLFRAVSADGGRLVTTNCRKVLHPDAAFDTKPIQINALAVKTMAVEWLYYMSVLQGGEKKKDGQLIVSGVDFSLFNSLQLGCIEMTSDSYEYYRMVDSYDKTLRDANVLTM